MAVNEGMAVPVAGYGDGMTSSSNRSHDRDGRSRGRWVAARGGRRLPPPRPLLWPLRPVQSARWSVTEDHGRVVVTVEHAPLAGVTTEMLRWWYRHVPGRMTYAGRTWPRYLVWHPLDHIGYQVVRPGATGGVGPGAGLHITEALGRDLGICSTSTYGSRSSPTAAPSSPSVSSAPRWCAWRTSSPTVRTGQPTCRG
jgi:hypothetical protein